MNSRGLPGSLGQTSGTRGRERVFYQSFAVLLSLNGIAESLILAAEHSIAQEDLPGASAKFAVRAVVHGLVVIYLLADFVRAYFEIQQPKFRKTVGILFLLALLFVAVLSVLQFVFGATALALIPVAKFEMHRSQPLSRSCPRNGSRCRIGPFQGRRSASVSLSEAGSKRSRFFRRPPRCLVCCDWMKAAVIR